MDEICVRVVYFIISFPRPRAEKNQLIPVIGFEANAVKNEPRLRALLQTPSFGLRVMTQVSCLDSSRDFTVAERDSGKLVVSASQWQTSPTFRDAGHYCTAI